jgi:hypothetical protein
MVASCEAFSKLKDELQERDIEVCAYLANGKPFAASAVHEIELQAEHCDVILVGMASDEKLAKEEMAACKVAIEMGVPFGFYADTYGVCQRKWFEKLCDKASFLFVVNEEEAETARELYPNAIVFVTGNPTWEDYFYPRMSREEVRAKLGVEDNETMVLCPGGKSLVVNILHWGGVIEALSQLDADSSHWKVFFSLHPGDQNKPESYSELVECKVPARLVTKSLMSSADMVAGCDLVIESASGIGTAAACQRKPTISYFSEIALARMEKAGGTRDWPPCDMGLSRMVLGEPDRLANVIIDLLYHDGFKEMNKRQEEIHPEPAERGAAERKMLAALMDVLS